ncbi:MAG: bifunctional diguanylate cyclase/phosphodiesterase [Alphaproteobacteria bacterium]|nr:bifunctional diguanylate cyclase/phosphodiesterase [Alphaproteobacteria bacterium]MBU0798190.1 bifunctional diguanylate cyclase/phosphodiesterase [Alphaproteobacteria bacterium]MBU0887592.1 bifunctional diguanylate cyclase/phosphodiesterase [Alphaproteobacteria bacterium]MBU1814243.1 bifunctional diguanylate cyclase/phosphodiesterase [Alphaproteobacteria bacterium]MBU2090557.1 bifunctional diguanylate cyclase/phosphodiesterase [Alphaproteobacteria bacterium]
MLLVVLSVLVATLASYTTLILSKRIVTTTGSATLWLGFGALSMGIGIWSMHFIGMLAFDLPIPLGYDQGMTVVSLIIAIVMSGFALMQIRNNRLTANRLLAAGLLLGLGIAAMHYTGMAAMDMHPGIIYHPFYFALSVLIAIVAATAALFIAFHLSRRVAGPLLLYQLIAALIMGLAIAGMHYTGMVAANFPLGTICRAAAGIDRNWLAGTVALVSIGILLATLGLALLDGRFERATSRLHRSLQMANTELKRLSLTDQLTGLPNRFTMVDDLQNLLEQPGDDGLLCAVMFLDIDRFKFINDSQGHGGGDELLRQTATRLRASYTDRGAVARFGGDKFVAVLHGLRDPSDIVTHVEQLRDTLRQTFRIRGRDVPLSFCIGIAVAPNDGQDAKALIGHAEKAMYAAKAEGPGHYRFYKPTMQEAAVREFELQRALREAIPRGELELFLQPKFCARRARIVSAEALMRWHHPEHGLLLPGQFLPVAEKFGILGQMEEWAIREACRILRSWSQNGIESSLSLAVNVSALQFRATDFVDRLLGLKQEFELTPGQLILEITEGSAMRDPDRTASAMRTLSAAGFEFSIDDFGTGYSSLAQLKRLPFRELKIDRSFIVDIHRNADDRQIVEVIVSMARQFGMRVVAEGVEDRAVGDSLAALGVDLLQGYGFARPMPLRDFVGLAQAA